MKRQAENFHVVVGMTRLIKIPSYWFGDVLAVVFHIQKMFAETISQPSSCFADVKLVTGGAPYAIIFMPENQNERSTQIDPVLNRKEISKKGKVYYLNALCCETEHYFYARKVKRTFYSG